MMHQLPATGKQGRENRALNAMRSCAAIVVVIVHARLFLLVSRQDFDPNPFTSVAYALTSFGHGAVLVFFVLSGYFVGGSVIASTRSTSFDWKRYSISRLTRLWIVLIPALLLTLLVDTMGRNVSPSYYEYINRDHDLLTLFGNVFFLQGSYVTSYGSNEALWSLAYEAFYYTLFPLVLVGVLQTRGRKRLACIMLSGCVVLVANFHVWILFPIWLAGALLAHYEERIRSALSGWSLNRLRIAQVCTLALFIASLIADRVGAVAVADNASIGSIAVGVCTVVLVVLLFFDLHPKRRLSKAALGSLSFYAGSSYSLYAVHMPLLFLAVAVLNPVSRGPELWHPSAGAWLAVAIVVGGLVVLGWLFSQVTERHTDRVRRWVIDRLPQGE